MHKKYLKPVHINETCTIIGEFMKLLRRLFKRKSTDIDINATDQMGFHY